MSCGHVAQGIDDEVRRTFGRNSIRVDDQVIASRILDVPVEVGLQIAPAGQIGLLDKGPCGGDIDALHSDQTADAGLKGGDQPYMKAAGQGLRDDMRPASDKDHVANMGQLEDRRQTPGAQAARARDAGP